MSDVFTPSMGQLDTTGFDVGQDILAQNEQQKLQFQAANNPAPMLPPQNPQMPAAIDPSVAVKQVMDTRALQEQTHTNPVTEQQLQQQNFQQINGAPQNKEAPMLSPENFPSGQQAFQGQQPQAAQQPQKLSPQEQLESYYKEQQASLANEMSLNNKIAANAASMEAQKAAEYSKHIQKMNGYATELDDAHKSATGKVEAAMKEREQALADYKDMLTDPKKLDEAFRPKGIFEGKSTGQSIMGAIAIALGGVGAAFQGPGSVNQALSLITKKIDQENEGRKEAYKTKLFGSQNLANEAGKTADLAGQQEGRDIAAINNKKIMQLEAVSAKINQLASNYNSKTVADRAAMANEGIQRQISGLKMENAKQQYSMEMMKNLGGMDLEKFEQLSPAQQQIVPEEMRKTFAEQRERNIPGYGLASNKEAAGEFRKALPELEQVVNGGRRILDLMTPGAKFNMDDRTKIQTMAGLLMGPMREQMGFKTLTDSDQKLLHKVMGDPTSLTSLNSLERTKMQTIINETQNTIATRAKNAGLKPKSGDLYGQQIMQQFGGKLPNFK
jgi:hypothetical protein